MTRDNIIILMILVLCLGIAIGNVATTALFYVPHEEPASEPVSEPDYIMYV